MEEFEEFDVLFSENTHHEKKKKKKTGLDSMKVYPENDLRLQTSNEKHSASTKEEEKKRKNKKLMPISVPMRIPGNSILNRMESDCNNYDIFEEDEFEFEGRRKLFVPPHLMVDRRTSKRMAFSVCTGNGRTLKGRDLSRVRNSVLRMTGFIETC